MDNHGHGTHMTGVIGMSTNAIGGVGLVWDAGDTATYTATAKKPSVSMRTRASPAR